MSPADLKSDIARDQLIVTIAVVLGQALPAGDAAILRAALNHFQDAMTADHSLFRRAQA